MSDGPSTPGEDPVPAAVTDRLEALRAELEDEVDALPVADRVRRFEHANEVLAAELAVLDEV